MRCRAGGAAFPQNKFLTGTAPLAARRDPAYVYRIMPTRKPDLGTIVLLLALLVILAAALWYAASTWLALSGPPMPAVGYVAMTLGIVFSLVIGCGLMALIFYSSRHGYDEPHPTDDERE